MQAVSGVHPIWTLAPSVGTVRETTQQQGDVVLQSRVIYSEDNLQQTTNMITLIGKTVIIFTLFVKRGYTYDVNTKMFPHLNIGVKTGIANTRPVLSGVKTQSVHTRSKQFFCDEPWATSIVISGPVETWDVRYVKKFAKVMFETLKLIYNLFFKLLPSGYQCPVIGGGDLSREADGHVWSWDAQGCIQHVSGEQTWWAGHCCALQTKGVRL